MINSKYTRYKELIIDGKVSSAKIAKMIGGDCTASAIRSARRRFLKPNECAQTNANWRKNNRDKENTQQRKRRTQSNGHAPSLRDGYSEEENALILSGKHKAAKLAHKLGRTVDGIYTQKYRLKKGLKE